MSSVMWRGGIEAGTGAESHLVGAREGGWRSGVNGGGGTIIRGEAQSSPGSEGEEVV